MNEFPKRVEISIDEERYWEGLGRQEMNFHQVVGELVDNSISASGKDADGDLLPFKVEITLEKLGNKIKVKVADQGIGMTVEEITKHIFSLGGKGRSEGPLNEHGFGLKNALCVLTVGNKLSWWVATRDEGAVNKKNVYFIKGPFSRNMKLELGDLSRWSEEIIHATADRGTRVYGETPFSFFNTLYKRARLFETLVERFIEHLSVMYKGFLKNPHNKLWLRWRNLGDDENNPNLSANWEEFRLKPINIPYDLGESQRNEIQVDGPEGIAEAIYVRGNLDVEKVRVGPKVKPYPLRIYYQGNIQTQGIDIVVRRRVLKFAQLPEIWVEVPRHNNFNKFTGELILNDPRFRTVNNKISLDPHNPYWVGLLEKLDNDDFKPQRITGTRIEGDLAKKLKAMLEGLYTDSRVQRDKPIWSGTGIKVDIYHELHNEDIHIYEIKAGTAAPIDAYQLLMYWDGVVKDENKSPKVGRLVAKDIPDSVQNIISEINNRKDSLGDSYNLECKTVEELGL